jgi:hypothetical protein
MIQMAVKCHTRDSIPTKTNNLLQGLYVLLNTINEMSSNRPSVHQPKWDLVVTITLECIDEYGM